MEKKDWEQRLEDFYFEKEKILPNQSVGIDIDDWKEFIQQELSKAREEGREEGINAVLFPKFKRDKNGTLKREGWVDTSKLEDK